MGKRLCLVLACFVMAVGMAFAQKTVSGTVLDAHTAEPIIGAAVMVKGTAVGAPTDVYGRFTIKDVPEGAKILKVTYLGMKDKEVAIKANVKIYMEQDAQAVDEVMVVAYGSQKRSAFTGSAVEIKSEDIASHVTSSATNALVGKVAGLSAVSSDGAPGSAPAIRIRGIGSMNASSAPLYIVDGAPFDGAISSINPQDIESISVLKDASSSAIYGARGANGVIIITTKKGNSHDAQVTFDAKWGSNSRLIPQYDVIDDPAQYYETHYRAMFNSKYYYGATAAEAYAFADANIFNSDNGGLGYQVYTIPTGEKFIGTNFKLNPNATLGYCDGTYTYRPDDWYDETYDNSFRQEYNVSVNGQAEKLNYYANVGYLNDGGTVANSGFERYSARTNVEYQAKDWLKLSTNMSFTSVETETPSYDVNDWGSSGNLFYITNSIAPIYPLYVRDADGNIMTDNGRVVYDANQTNFKRPGFVGNAVRNNLYDRYKGVEETFSGKWAATITPVKGLILQATLSATNITNRSTSLVSRFGGSEANDGAVRVASGRYFTINQLYTANYHATVNEKHNFDVLLGYEQYKVTSQSLNGYNDHLYDPFVGELGNAHGIKNKSTSSSTGRYMSEGFFSRLQYDFMEKYFFNASVRRDASSRLHPDNRWGTFGSLGAAWQINKESFLEDASWIDLLKLKASWGSMGNDAVSNRASSYMPYIDMYEVSYDENTGEYSTVMVQKGNDKLTWETNESWNVGVDFSFFKYRLNGTLDFFHRKTTDLLYTKELPLSSGINAPYYPVNVGSMVNRGVELSLDGTPIKTENWQWNLNLNLTHYVNEVTEIDPADQAAGGIKSGSRIIAEGGSIYDLYLKKYAGVDKSTGKALYYKDVVDAEGNVTGVTTTTNLASATQYNCGTTLPDLVGGFGTSLKYRDFDLSAQFSFQVGGKTYDGVYQSLMHNGQSTGHAMHKDLLDAWSPENTNSNIPRLSTAAADDPGVGSQTPIDRFVVKSDYLALNNLTLGYTLPKSLLLPLGVSSLRVYVAGENLFLLTKRQGLDPRFNFGTGSMTSGAGLASGGYAAMRTITAGITLKF